MARREEIVIPNQGHTLACMLRSALFENMAENASCIVVHPQDTNLKVEIKHKDPKTCLLLALRDVRSELEGYMSSLNSHQIQTDLCQDATMSSE